MKKTILTILLTCMRGMLFTACGDDGGSSGSGSYSGGSSGGNNGGYSQEYWDAARSAWDANTK